MLEYGHRLSRDGVQCCRREDTASRRVTRPFYANAVGWTGILSAVAIYHQLALRGAMIHCK